MRVQVGNDQLVMQAFSLGENYLQMNAILWKCFGEFKSILGLTEAVEASITPGCGMIKLIAIYEVRKSEKLSIGSATSSRVQFHRVHFQEHNLSPLIPVIRKDGTNRSQSTSISPFQASENSHLLQQYQEQQQEEYNLDSTRHVSVQHHHHHSTSGKNQSVSSSCKFIMQSTDHQSDFINQDSIILGNKPMRKEFFNESRSSSSSSGTLSNKYSTSLNNAFDKRSDNGSSNDVSFQRIEQKMISEMEKLRLITLSPSMLSLTTTKPSDGNITITSQLPVEGGIEKEMDMNRLKEEYKTISNCEYLLTKARQACENQSDLSILTADLIKHNGLLETLASRLIKQSPFPSEAHIIDSSQDMHTLSSLNDNLDTSEQITEATDNLNGKSLKLSGTVDLESSDLHHYNEANKQIVIGSARLLSQILSENHLLNVLDEKLSSQKYSSNPPCELVFDQIDKRVIQKQECNPSRTSPSYDNDYEKSTSTTPTNTTAATASLPTTLSLSQTISPYNEQLQSCKCWEYREDVDIYREYLAILEPLLKHTETMCNTVVEHGGLRSLIYASVCLMNLALFGGSEGHSEMMRQHAIEWLFCLAFHQDEVIKYFACLTSAVLSTNPELTAAVNASGTLNLVVPFVRSHSPIEFARKHLVAAFQCSCKNNFPHTPEIQTTGCIKSDTIKSCCQNQYKGGSADWLNRLTPVMFSKQFEPRVLVTFHFAVEATLKSDMKLVNSTFMESKFAAMALHILGEEVPSRLPAQVPLWDHGEVECWLSRVRFKELAYKFSDLRVDGDLLLRLDECILEKDLGVKNGITRSRLLRELCSLKINADYSAVDPTGICAWLREATRITALNSTTTPRNPTTSDYNLNENDFQNKLSTTNISNTCGQYCYTHDLSCLNQSFDLLQYAYNLISAGVHRPFLPYLSDKMLLEDCQIKNGIHRKRILDAIQSFITMHNQFRLTDHDSKLNIFAQPDKYIDVFISYRRSNGSQLASLLKVHFQLRGYRVFLDIDRLTAGKFHESLLHSIRSSHNFVLVLTPRALDRCLNDTHCTDWIHKEVVCALKSECNIIPITDNFTWPPAESLPEDLRPIITYNAVNCITASYHQS
ncbi:unnamed protein product [Heterobilharzia americana]|nr:unnamed protein product [Heterobilharzia americana]